MPSVVSSTPLDRKIASSVEAMKKLLTLMIVDAVCIFIALMNLTVQTLFRGMSSPSYSSTTTLIVGIAFIILALSLIPLARNFVAKSALHRELVARKYSNR